jgi:hypothetical protein
MKAPLYPENHTKCCICRNISNFSEFSPAYRNNRRMGVCRKCKNTDGRIRYKKLKETLEGQKHIIIMKILRHARERAKKHSLPYNLDYEWVKSNLGEYCPILGIKFNFNSNKVSDESLSLDKILPEKGYVKENCKIISYKANRLKSNCSLEEIELIIKYLEKYERK